MKLTITRIELHSAELADAVDPAVVREAMAALNPSAESGPTPPISAETVDTVVAEVAETRAIAAPPEVAAPRQGARGRKAAAKPAVASEGSSTITGRILEALQKRPMSSLELAQALKLEPSQVYAPCSLLKGKGQIENRPDPEDGTRRYFAK